MSILKINNGIDNNDLKKERERNTKKEEPVEEFNEESHLIKYREELLNLKKDFMARHKYEPVEACEWTNEDGFYYSECNEEFEMHNTACCISISYCPCCGKSIKIKE